MYLVSVKQNRYGLKIIVQPKAKKTRILGLHDNMVKLAVAAPPVDGKANKQVISFLARLFGIKKKDVEIISGKHSRKKICLLGELKEADLRETLEPYL